MDIKYEDYRVIREALSYCGRYGSSAIRSRSIGALGEFARRVAPYCECPDRARVGAVDVCLDCGKRHAEKTIFSESGGIE